MTTIMEVFKKENKNLCKIETYLVETDQLNAGMSSKISNKKVLNENIKKTVNRIVTIVIDSDSLKEDVVDQSFIPSVCIRLFYSFRRISNFT